MGPAPGGAGWHLPGDNPESRKRSLPSQSANSLMPPAFLRPPPVSTPDLHPREEALSLEVTSPRRPAGTARPILHSDVAASDTRVLRDSLQVTGTPDSPQCVRGHVVTRPRDAGHGHLGSCITGAGKPSQEKWKTAQFGSERWRPAARRIKPSSWHSRPPIF